MMKHSATEVAFEIFRYALFLIHYDHFERHFHHFDKEQNLKQKQTLVSQFRQKYD